MRGTAYRLQPRIVRPVSRCALRHRRRWPIRPVHHQFTPSLTRAIGLSGPRLSPRIGCLRRPSGKIAVRVRRSRNRPGPSPCSDGRSMGIPYHESPSSREPAIDNQGTPVSVGRGRSVELGHRTVRRPSNRIPDRLIIGACCLAKSTMATAADTFFIGTPVRLGRRVRHPLRDGGRDRAVLADEIQIPPRAAAEAGNICRRRGHRSTSRPAWKCG